MTEFEALVSLNMTGEIGSIRLKKLLDYFDKPQNIFSAQKEKISGICGISPKITERIFSFKKESLDNELKQAEKLKLKLLTKNSEEYPVNLKFIPDPPIVLYVKGEIKRQDALSIGMVGSRRPSFYGLSSAAEFSKGLASHGFTVVSGMARGIDTQSHKGALKAGGRTIAVMGSGFNHIYPRENKELTEEISKSGAVVSEFCLDTEPLKQNFPCRNRIISGLSCAVLVVEAAKNSGALITADFALEQGRDVFALPGKIDSSVSSGTNNLIKQGAKLVSSLEDILEEFNFNFVAQKNRLIPDKENIANNRQDMRLSYEESRLYDLISDSPVDLDMIIEKTDMNIPSISGLILKLEMKKLIRKLPGRQFVRS